jgi:hypothetical protein
MPSGAGAELVITNKLKVMHQVITRSARSAVTVYFQPFLADILERDIDLQLLT